MQFLDNLISKYIQHLNFWDNLTVQQICNKLIRYTKNKILQNKHKFDIKI